MKREFFIALVLFGVIVFAFFGIHLLFLIKEGFTLANYLIGFLLIFPALMIVGYILLSTFFETQEHQDEVLETLIRQTLHEINLPLATINTNLTMLIKKSQDERSIKQLKRVESASYRLARLYQELSYHLKRQIAPIKREVLDLVDIIKERSEFFIELRRNPIELDLESTQIFIDKIGLEQVIDNLLENAMKYSSKSKPIKIILHSNELKIIDEGVGMDANEILRVYERYYQSNRNIKGEGIGLAIVKRYCDDEGIDLRIDSTPQKGTEVSLNFSKVYFN